MTSEKFYMLKDAADMVGVRPAVLLGWVKSGKVTPDGDWRGLGTEDYLFMESSLPKLLKLAEKTDPPKPSRLPAWNPSAEPGTHWKVKQLARGWNLSEETVRKALEDEPGLIKLGNENPRGKRRYVSVRVPHNVALRVWRKLCK